MPSRKMELNLFLHVVHQFKHGSLDRENSGRHKGTRHIWKVELVKLHGEVFLKFTNEKCVVRSDPDITESMLHS